MACERTMGQPYAAYTEKYNRKGAGMILLVANCTRAYYQRAKRSLSNV